ncbi:MAG TPA: thiol:disulfide interchange protein DsbA/DsbL [Candidatus Dormibacteraeota bacterium]|nr:thiol:disulfide interchange protein DsbA/DsbL [Candidatus Dormibacteraeota bacterium]
MTPSRLLAGALLLALSACARQETPPAPAAPAPAPPAATTPAPAPDAATSAAAAQNETQQATASQESSDGDGERPARSDASLEQIASMPAGAQLPDGEWQPGVNYSPLVPAQPTSAEPGKVEVVEVFWLACPHCLALEPHIKSWLKSKPAYISFVRVPVVWGPAHKVHARLFYTLESLGRDDLIGKAMETIAQQHQMLAGNSDDESLKLQQRWAVQNGVNTDDFAKAWNSFTVSSNVLRAEQLTQRYHVEGVPFIVINGKYTTDVAKAGSEEKLMKLINDLAAAEHRH